MTGEVLLAVVLGVAISSGALIALGALLEVRAARGRRLEAEIEERRRAGKP